MPKAKDTETRTDQTNRAEIEDCLYGELVLKDAAHCV
jgi:hypothetical protein